MVLFDRHGFTSLRVTTEEQKNNLTTALSLSMKICSLDPIEEPNKQIFQVRIMFHRCDTYCSRSLNLGKHKVMCVSGCPLFLAVHNYYVH